jgi:large subunit ribosomal protein L15
MRRGAGHRGGRGNAGVKKHRKSWFLSKDPTALIDKGPGRPNVPKAIPRSVNIGNIDARADELVKSGLAKKKAKKLHLDLSEVGYDKLLGGGIVKNAWVIKADRASSIAARKVADAGGEILSEEFPAEVEESN